MNLWRVATIALVGAILLPAAVIADDEDEGAAKKPTSAQKIAKIVKLGPGVQVTKKDEDGRILACVVVGEARISTALGKAKGMELATEKANLMVLAEFVKWLKEEVQVYSSNEDETITLMEGTEDDPDSLKESGKSLEKSGRKWESITKGMVRGLITIHKEVDGEGKNLTIVKKWTAETSDGVKTIAADQADDSPKGAKTKGKRKKNDTEIESESVTSDDLDDVFP